MKGRYKPINPNKYQGDPTNIIYRSSWELKFMRFCDLRDDVVQWQSEESYKKWFTERRLDDRREIYLTRLKLEEKMNQATAEIVNILNQKAEKKRKKLLQKQEKQRQLKLEKEHLERMKILKKKAIATAKKFFQGSSLKQNFRSWAKYTAFIIKFRAERKKRRKEEMQKGRKAERKEGSNKVREDSRKKGRRDGRKKE